MLLDDLMLLSGNDIPFPEGQLMIHPLSPKEIGYITERNYFLGIDLLNFSKDKLSEQDRSRLVNQSDFDVLMSILMEQTTRPDLKERIDAVKMVLTLLFPCYEISFSNNAIVLQKEKEIPKTINAMNFEAFRTILQQMCLLNKEDKNNPNYNPQGPKGRALAEKFKKRREKLNNGKTEKIAVYSRYVSILAVALQLPLDTIMNYTIYQIDDQMERHGLYDAWQKYFAAKMAGATGMDDAENWMKDIHP